MRPLRQKTTVEATSWIAGLITEASPVNFPEGASIDEENFILSRDGSRGRRLGLGKSGAGIQELGHVSVSVSGSSTVSNTCYASMSYLWSNAAQNPGKNIFVYQYGNKLYFYNANSADSVSIPYFGASVSLTATVVDKFSFSSIQGNLVVAVGDQHLRIIEYVSSASYSLSQVRLKVRDFWGVDDGFATDERTSTLTDLHAYNLYNQGWAPEFFCSSDPANPNTMNNGAVEDPVERTKTSLGLYPSNADIMYTALTMLTNGRKAYYPHALSNIAFGNTPAANGHYVIDLFDRSQGRKDTYDADVAAGWTARRNYKTSIPTDQSTGGIKAVAAYAGRIFYACSAGETGGDSKSPHIGTFVLFSRLVDSVQDLSECYQEADPTAEDISDLIDTDGGYIQLPDAVNIKALIPFKSELLVFADNGVWSINGGPASAFTATQYQSQFLTNNGALSVNSIVTTPDAVIYWSRNGIFSLAMGQSGIEFKSLTEYTIQRLYNSISYNCKNNAIGIYDDASYRCRWLYQQEYNSEAPQKFTHELILDLSMPAWSRFKFYDLSASSTATPRLTGYLNTPVAYRNSVNSDFRYTGLDEAASHTYTMSLYYYNNTNFEDWSSVDAAAYLITGYLL